jgi:hypothetical protein
MRILFLLVCILMFGCADKKYDRLPTCMVSPTAAEYGDAQDYGMTYYTDLDKAKECSASTGRKILLVFTGYACMSVSGQEWRILRAENVRPLINDQFILVILYVDDKTKIPVEDSADLGSGIVALETVGLKWSALERQNFDQNSQPLYAVVDTALNPIAPVMGYTKDSVAFREMLESTLLR